MAISVVFLHLTLNTLITPSRRDGFYYDLIWKSLELNQSGLCFFSNTFKGHQNFYKAWSDGKKKTSVRLWDLLQPEIYTVYKKRLFHFIVTWAHSSDSPPTQTPLPQCPSWCTFPQTSWDEVPRHQFTAGFFTILASELEAMWLAPQSQTPPLHPRSCEDPCRRPRPSTAVQEKWELRRDLCGRLLWQSSQRLFLGFHWVCFYFFISLPGFKFNWAPNQPASFGHCATVQHLVKHKLHCQQFGCYLHTAAGLISPLNLTK